MPQEEFQSQIQAFGERVEQELLEGRLNFPTVMDVSLRIKRVADDPESSLDDIARIVKAEPVLSAKAVRMANAVAMNPYGQQITNVGDAVRRIGLASLRCLAYAVSAEQLSQDFRSRDLRLVATGLWMHTVDVACWAHAIAHETRSAKPDTALFAGMMADIGQFFLLARAADYPAVADNLEHFAEFVSTWSVPVGRSILESFGLPDSILDAYPSYDNPYGGAWPPASLADTIFLATLVAETHNPFDNLLGIDRPSLSQAIVTSNVDEAKLQEMLSAARNTRTEMLSAVCA